MERKLKRALKDALKIEMERFENPDHKEQVLSSVKSMRSMLRRTERIGLFEFMLRQIPFIGKDIWMMQGGAALSVSLVLYLIVGVNIQYFPVRYIPPVLGVMAVVLVMTSVPLMLRSYRYQMHETEMATRMSHLHVFLAYILLLSIEYLAVFVFVTGVSVHMAGLPAEKAAVYFVFPLFLAGAGCVQLIRRTDGWEKVSRRLGVCEGYCILLVAGLVLLYHMKQPVYDSTGLWAVLTAAGFAMYVQSVCSWVKEI